MPLVSPDLLDRLLEVVSAPVLIADRGGTIVRANGAAEAVLGYRHSDVAALNARDLYHRVDEARRVLASLRMRGADVPPTAEPFDVSIRSRGGEVIPVRLTVTLLRSPEGEELGTLGVFEDRREQIAMDKRLLDAAGQVEASERRAAGMAAVANAVHELAQPLTAAMGQVEMLLSDDELSAPARRQAERAYEQLLRIESSVAALALEGRRRGGEGGR